MITWHEELPFDFSSAVVRRFFTEDAIFFDIETTGFSPAHSKLYLIGCATRKGDLLCIDQFFAEDTSEEGEVLTAFFTLLEQYQTILSFNGVGFDIPYLKGKCQSLHLPSPFESHACLDIYKEASQIKALLGLSSLKQKSIEIFLGIDRKDLYSGGELIDIYKSYTVTPSKEALTLLRQHNYEDVLYMPSLLFLLAYREAFADSLSIRSLKARQTPQPDGSMKKELLFTLTSEYPFPKPVSYGFDGLTLDFFEEKATLVVPLLDEELRFFLDNPKDYYYLPEEDCAVHKNLAAGVSKERRRQATAANCYVRRHAVFLPQYKEIFSPAFRKNLRDKKSYFALTKEFAASKELQLDYVRHLLASINTKRLPPKK